MRAIYLCFLLFISLVSAFSSPAQAISESKTTGLRSNYEESSLDSRNTPSSNVTKSLGSSGPHSLQNRTTKHARAGDGVLDVVKTLKNIFLGLVGTGQHQPVKLTWYTGHDLLNPSCVSKSKWSPTDKAFVGAIAFSHWSGGNKPGCGDFVEACYKGHCVFIRVLDTCAGCRDSHIDLTRAAFGALASFDLGVMQAEFRPAKNAPKNWDTELWGPKEL